MSSVVSGENEALFAALKEVFKKTAKDVEIVMTLTLSNACPVGK
jgi:hypothetical protein